MKKKKVAAKKSSVRRVAKKPATRSVSKKTPARARTARSGNARDTTHKPAAAATRTTSGKAAALAKYSQTGAPWWKAHL